MGPLEGEASLLNPSPHRLIGVKRRPARRFPAEPLALADVEALRAGCSRRAPTAIRNRALLAVLFRSGLRISAKIDPPKWSRMRTRAVVSRPCRLSYGARAPR